MDRRYFIAILFGAAAAVVCVVLVYPKFQQVRATSRAVDERQGELDSQNFLIKEIGRLNSEYKQMEKEISRVFAVLPAFTPQSVPKLFVELAGLSAENGLTLETVSFTEEGGNRKTAAEAVQKKPYRIVNTQLALKGSYQDVKRFARAVETNEHLMDITLLFVFPPETAEGETEKAGAPLVEIQPFSFKMSVNAYYQ